MNEEIFRKKSLDKVKSPERLDDYIRVTNPGIWLLLISVILLLAGAFVWGIFGHIDSTVPTVVCIENGEAVCYIQEQDLSAVQTGMTVKFSDTEAVITGIEQKSGAEYTCALSAGASLPDGVYEGKIVTATYKPVSFILN